MHRSVLSATRAALLPLAALLVHAAPAPAQSTVVGSGLDMPLAQLADSAALLRALSALQVPALPQGALPVFWVDYDRTGAVTSVRPAFQDLPAGYARPVTAALRAHLKPQHPFRRPFSTYVWAVLDVRTRVEEPSMNPPQLIDSLWVSRGLRRTMSRHLGRLASPARPEYLVRMELHVREDGTAEPGSAAITQSSGEAVLDSAVVAMADSMHFRPATLAQRPVPAWLEMAVVLELPVEGVPPLSALVDSAALVQAVAGLPEVRLPRNAPPIFRITFLRTGPVVEPVFSALPASWAGPVTDAIRSHLNPQAGDRADELYLRVTPAPRAAVARACQRQNGTFTGCVTPAGR